MHDDSGSSSRGGLDPARWPRLSGILDEALTLPPDQVPGYLDHACGQDVELRSQVERILAADAKGTYFLSRPASDVSAEWIVEDAGSDTAAIPAEGRIGPWRILREVGRGGMGAVYLAERADGAYEQRVALKRIKRGLDTDDVLRRFAQERRILARLEHPNIARLIDGGTAPDGSPFLAMEYVDGEPITVHCSRRNLSLDGVIDLFLQAARAVQFAHQNLVVHRDLKPGNIFVSDHGLVKLLDFGVAKLLSRETAEDGLTHAAARMLTPYYAAPEQIRGEPVTTATDVYALGVVLYELLAGIRPLEAKTGSLEEAARLTLEREPAPPSVALARADVDPRRGAWRDRVRGDLDNIVLKALRKDARQRYPSAQSLLDDLERYRAGLPVRATRPTAAYRARRFVRRHRAAVGAGAAVLVSMIAGLIAVSWQARVATRERDRARFEARKAEETNAFVMSLFDAADPNRAKGETVTARQLLDRGAERIERELRGQPGVQAEMYERLGGIYRRLGLFEKAQELTERSAAIRERTFGAESPEVAASLVSLGAILSDRARFARAESVLTRAVAIRRARLGGKDPAVAAAIMKLANAIGGVGRFAPAESLYREALAIDEAALGPEHATVGDDLNNLGVLYYSQGRTPEAMSCYERALRIRLKAYGREHLLTATTIENIATAAANLGQAARAESLHYESIAIRRKLLGPDNLDMANSLSNLGPFLFGQGKLAEAESVMAEALRIHRKGLGDENPETARCMNNLAYLYMSRGRFAEAEPLFRKAFAVWSATIGPDHASTLRSEASLAHTLHEMGRSREATGLFGDVLARAERVHGASSAGNASILHTVGVTWRKEGRLAGAERLLRRALAIQRESPARSDGDIAQTELQLGFLLRMRGNHEESRAMLEDALALSRARQDSSTIATATIQIGRTLTSQRRFTAAERMLRSGLAARQRLLPGQDPGVAEAKAALGLCLAAMGREPEATRLLREGISPLRQVPPTSDPLVREVEHLLAQRRESVSGP